MIDGLSVAVVIPCRNEESALNKILPTMPNEIDEIIVVDNNSTDRTADVAQSLGAKVLREHRVGYGYALRTGMQAATSDIIVTIDGDGTYPIHCTRLVVNEMVARKIDFVSCTRMPRQDTGERLWVRIFGVKVLNIFVNLLYNYPMRDCLSGMMVMYRDKFSDRSYEEGDWNLNVEIKLIALVDPKIRFTEIHIPYHDRVLEQSKQQIFITGFKHLWYLFRFRFTRAKRYKMASIETA
jgi:glycosyltransferase involved in cell wall biosynthesis